MDALDSEDSPNSPDMAPARNYSESSHLVSPNLAPRPNYITFVSYVCFVIFFCIISYCSFYHGVRLFAFHPIFMSLGWLLLMTIGVNSITPGDFASEWIPIRLRSTRHWVIQLFAGTLIIFGFLVILANKIVGNRAHFTTVHGKLGLTTFIFMFCTMLGGLGALYSLKIKDYVAPIYTKAVHSLAGMITYFLGAVTICVGLYSTWWVFGDFLRIVSLILVLFIASVTVRRPIFKLYLRLKERFDNGR